MAPFSTFRIWRNYIRNKSEKKRTGCLSLLADGKPGSRREREKRSKISTTADSTSLAKTKRSRACFSLYVLYTTTYYILLRQYYDYRLLDLYRLSFSVRIISRVWHLSDPFNGLSSIRRVMPHVEYFFPFSPFRLDSAKVTQSILTSFLST